MSFEAILFLILGLITLFIGAEGLIRGSSALALKIGIDPVHLGIIMVVNGAIGMFTPPFGLNLFVASGVSKLSISKIISGVIPFIIISLITLLIITFVPQLTLWLPNVLK